MLYSTYLYSELFGVEVVNQGMLYSTYPVQSTPLASKSIYQGVLYSTCLYSEQCFRHVEVVYQGMSYNTYLYSELYGVKVVYQGISVQDLPVQ